MTWVICQSWNQLFFTSASKCGENQREIASERKQLKLAAKKKQMHEECNALAKQLGTRPRKKVELEQ